MDHPVLPVLGRHVHVAIEFKPNSPTSPPPEGAAAAGATVTTAASGCRLTSQSTSSALPMLPPLPAGSPLPALDELSSAEERPFASCSSSSPKTAWKSKLN